ncbi:SirB2 family protein [Pseudothauera rhizosphaerae]|uniref:Regulator SirB n=1 Tax=Pseudothauera rhizosphaerae TaxID=2565932 RepID=A0A4S4AWH1_9RHOO|nr:SirB2 family protein [Pseudothauera rhizosphaerae]THF64379.1 regulator SirB [Pseudothauera rhizosphaerae]
MYLALKHLHVSCVVLSIAGFTLRGLWMLAGSRLLGHRLTRVLPHIVDSVLLLSAVALAAMSGQYPFVAGWVTAKVAGLLAYIVLGAVALRRGRTRTVRAAAFVGALAVYGWVVSVALSRNPAGFLSFVGVS